MTERASTSARFVLILSAAAMLLGAALVAGCSSTPGTLTADDSGSTVELAVGETFQVELESNRTTGYTWTRDGDLPPLIRQVGEPEYVESSSGGAVGAGGLETWTFQAMEPGTGTVKLKYSRPFEAAEKPEQTFEVTAQVK